jgi:hypothetical protein
LELEPELPDLFSLTVLTSKAGGVTTALTGVGGDVGRCDAEVCANDVTARDAATSGNSFPLKNTFVTAGSIMIGTILLES